jgi:hypothetical protein
VSHPIWNGLPSSFQTSIAVGTSKATALINGGTAIASCTECGGVAGVAVLDPNAAGRVVHIVHEAGFIGNGVAGNWYDDANLVTMLQNSALWAAHCM